MSFIEILFIDLIGRKKKLIEKEEEPFDLKEVSQAFNFG